MFIDQARLHILVLTCDYFNGFRIGATVAYKYKVLESLGRLACGEGGRTKESPAWGLMKKGRDLLCGLVDWAERAWAWGAVIFTFVIRSVPGQFHRRDEYSQTCGLG